MAQDKQNQNKPNKNRKGRNTKPNKKKLEEERLQKEKEAAEQAAKLLKEKEEAERLRKENELRKVEQQKKDKEDRIQQMKQTIQDAHLKLEEFYKEKQEKRKQRLQLQQDAESRPTASKLKTLDSGIKRNTGLIKRLKQGITDDNVGHLCKEIPLLNLTRYVSEAVSAIVEFKPKSSVPAIARICVLMHARYSEFTTDLIPRLQKLLEVPSSFENDQEKRTFYNRKKEIVKLLVELFLVGILSDDSLLYSIISEHVKNTSKEFNDDDLAIYGLILQITWARSTANEFMGIPPAPYNQILQGQQQLDEMIAAQEESKETEENKQKSETNEETGDPDEEANVDEDKTIEDASKVVEEERKRRICELNKKIEELENTTPLLSPERQQEYLELAKQYFEMISKHMISLHKQLRAMERENVKIVNLKGELTEKRSDSYAKQLKSHDRLLNGVNSLAELLLEEAPKMPEEDRATRITGDIGLADLSRLQAQNEEEGIFGDEDTRSFYEDIRSLRELLPAVFFDSKTSNIDDKTTDSTDDNTENEVASDDDTAEIVVPESTDNSTPLVDGDETSGIDKEVKEESKPEKTNPKLEEFVRDLPKCVNRELIDDAAMNFCYMATKGNRKRLPRCLFNVPRQELELLPYYSRLVATLYPVYPEISEKLIEFLQGEFGFLVGKKDQTNIETKIRNVRFLGELTKFKICPAKVVLKCLQICLANFSHHNIDMACNLLESCGRFLYRSPETHVRTSNLLDTMMRLKNAKNFDSRMETLIENAFYYCKPPERVTFRKERTPIQEYIRHLIFRQLNKSTLKDVIRKLCKLDWSAHGKYLVKCILNLKNISYSNIPVIANLVASFRLYQPNFGVQVVDNALHIFYEGLIQNDVTRQQHRVMNIKFMGELYSFMVIDTSMIFNLLYTLITFPSADNDSFRVRLVCTLISTCSAYFGSAADKRKFSRFLVYFQCYYFSLEFIPYDVEFMMADTLGNLPKQFKRLKTPEDAQKALHSVRQANASRNIVPFSLDRLQISFEGSADAIEEDIADLEVQEETKPSTPSQRPNSKTKQSKINSKEEEEEPKPEETNEDDEFDQLFDSMVRDSLSGRKTDQPSNGLTMAVPMNLFRSSNSLNTKRSNEQEATAPTRTFRLLMKKGNKQTTCNLEVPSESPFANRGRDDEWEEEQRAVKAKVLEYEAQEAEEQMLGNETIPYDVGRHRDPSRMKPKNKNLFWSNTNQ